jgi:predicted alpha/beta superfamily hydrolase
MRRPTVHRAALLASIPVVALLVRGAVVPSAGDVDDTHAVGGRTGVVGDLRMHELPSRVFGNTRQLRVLVPRGYDAPENRARRYAVLYLNDGQNLFDSTTSMFNPTEWRVDETVDSMVAAGAIPPLLVVGIDNAGRRGRFHEYFPWVDEYLDPPDPDPQGARYPEFLLEEVIPFVESRYRTQPGPDGRGLGGSSAGALAALYTAVTRPAEFGRLLVESPSIYVDDGRILREAAGVRAWPARMYFGVGTNEGGRPDCRPAATDEPELVRHVRELVRLIERDTSGTARTVRIHVEVASCAVHDEAAWGRRLPTALAFLYGPLS